MIRIRQPGVVLALAAACASTLLAPAASAQPSWPSKPVKLVVPFTPGSATDIIARAVGERLQPVLGQPVVVENRPGAGGTVGSALVAQAAPDGYTLLVQSSGHTVNPHIYATLSYDTLRDFAGVTPLVQLPNVLIVAPSKGYRSVAELVAAAKARPGALNYASAGSGSATHMNSEKFRAAAGIDALHIPMKGTPEAITDRPGAIDLVNPQGRVEFRDVWFRYPAAATVTVASLEAPSAFTASDPDHDVLQGVSLTIEPGETVALVGASGSGKTTMSGLVPRLYDVTGGALLIDGHDVRDLTQHSLREAIGVVSQDPHLFHETIGQNLKYAKPDATVAELDVACAGARILDTIRALPDGYETVVGERGYTLSGGQRQRIAIARTLLVNPRILVLDDATSAIDVSTEEAIHDALETLMVGRTTLVIAHRLSTISLADRVLLLEEGRIVASGTHAELLATEPRYVDVLAHVEKDDDEEGDR